MVTVICESSLTAALYRCRPSLYIMVISLPILVYCIAPHRLGYGAATNALPSGKSFVVSELSVAGRCLNIRWSRDHPSSSPIHLGQCR